VIGGYYAAHRKVLQDEASRQLQEAERLRERYTQAPGGSELARRLTEQELDATNRAAGFAERAEKMGGVRGQVIAGKIPIVGSLITAAGIWYEISNGKPAGKAVMSGVASLGAGAVIGLAIGGPVAVTAVGGVLASAVAGVTADAIYDGLPEGVQDAIDDGVEAIGEGIGSVWNAIF
jgi:hypothetical protein